MFWTEIEGYGGGGGRRNFLIIGSLTSMYKCRHKTREALLTLIQLFGHGVGEVRTVSTAVMACSSPGTPAHRWDVPGQARSTTANTSLCHHVIARPYK